MEVFDTSGNLQIVSTWLSAHKEQDTMLDIIQFIEEKGGNPEIIRKSQKARGDSVEIVDEIIAEYKAWTKSECDYRWSDHEI